MGDQAGVEMTVGVGPELGDAIYALPAIRAMWATKLYAVEVPWCRLNWHRRSKALKRLVESQSYVESWQDHKGEHLDADLTTYRNYGYAFGETITNRIARFARVRIDQSAWLSADPDPRTKDRLVINRCPRWHGQGFPWKEIVQMFQRDILFIGLEGEWRTFCAQFGVVEYLRTTDLYDAARAISGSQLFLGNQSSCNAICEGLKHPSVLETCPTSMDCWTNRPNCTYSVTGELSFEVLGKTFSHRPVNRGHCFLTTIEGSEVFHYDPFLCQMMARCLYLVKGLPVPTLEEIKASLVRA